MKSDSFQSRPLQYPLEHMQDAIWRDRPACGRWEYILAAATNFFSLRFQNFYRVCWNGNAAVGVFRFQRRLYHSSVLPHDLPADVENAVFQIDVIPFQSQQFSAPKAGEQVDVVEFEYTAFFGFIEEGGQLVRRDGFHFLAFNAGKGAGAGGIAGKQLLVDGESASGGDHLVNVPHRFGTQPFGFAFRLNAVYPSAFQQLFVELLEIHGGHL